MYKYILNIVCVCVCIYIYIYVCISQGTSLGKIPYPVLSPVSPMLDYRKACPTRPSLNSKY